MFPAWLRKIGHSAFLMVALITVVSLFLPPACADEPAAEDDRVASSDPPNVVFFLSDDQRFNFMGCAGHPLIETPTMDRLASDGVRFTNAMVTTSICAASRASYFTSLHERTHRYTFGTPPLQARWVATSYPAVLRTAGYETMFVGKFGVNVEKAVRETMFDHFMPLNRSPYFKPQADGSKRHISQICADRVVEFLQNRDTAKPFCVSVSFNAPHAEDGDKADHYPHPMAVSHLYADREFPQPELSDPAVFESQPEFLRTSMNRGRWFWRWDTPEKYQKNIRDYSRMISGVDLAMGRVLQQLQQMDLSKNTVVIFASDNGYYAASRGFAGKWSHYEESLRIPMIIYDPRNEAATGGTTRDEMVLNIDIPATILATAGVALPETYQGRSLLPLVAGDEPEAWRTASFCEHLMDHADIPKWEGVRDQRWVYARYFEQSPPFEFLHDLQSDPQQLQNLADSQEFAEQLAEMRVRCDARRDELGGPYRPNPRR